MASAHPAVSPESPQAPGDVTAGGAVVFGPGRSVLLVHRPKYDDWSFPKGKVERSEHVTATAVREVAEETGVHVRLGVPLDDQHYPVRSGQKTVHYWVGRPVGNHDVEGYRANGEVDRVAWVDLDLAPKRLTYPHDAVTLGQAVERRAKTRTLVIVRHASARSRRTWKGDDRLRTLLKTGTAQAQRLIPILAAYDVRHLLSSPSTRCVQTLQPYAETTGRRLRTDVRLSEEGFTARRVSGLMRDLLHGLVERPAGAGGVVVCSHRPVLPALGEGVGLSEVRLETAELLLVHLRGGAVVATEHH